MKTIISILILVFITGITESQSISDWRPENRTGVSVETGLLKSWPADGPKLLWSNLELGKGYSSPSFGASTIYITGLSGKDDILYALSMDGKMLWHVVMGRAWNGDGPESRATPVVEGSRIYTCSGFGDLACIDATSGKIIWTYKASELHKGTYGPWGIAESPLIDGQKLYFSPGGPETMTIALDKTNGKLIWKSASINDDPAYVSPILIERGNKKLIINISQHYVFAVNAANGAILWKIDHISTIDSKKSIAVWPDAPFIKCVTPLYKDGKIYITGGYDHGGALIGISEDGTKASVTWTDQVLDVHHGGAVLVNGYIYGSNWINNSTGNWCCIDWKTGKKMWEEKWKCKGSIIAAEGMLYIYEEKNGNVGLVKASPEKFDLISSFMVSLGDAGPFWAHPVIHNGILYLRHTNALMAYKIK